MLTVLVFRALAWSGLGPWAAHWWGFARFAFWVLIGLGLTRVAYGLVRLEQGLEDAADFCKRGAVLVAVEVR
jgi:hypothetical protein